MREKINILCATDDNYAPYTGVLAMSIFCSNEDEQIDMYILIDPSVSEENKNKLRAVSSVRHNINLLSISNDIILSQDINPSKRFPATAYFRLLAHEILPTSVQKVLYLDIDMVVRKNLSELYNTNLNGYACAGVVDSEYYNESFYQTLNIPQRYVYINSGMLLMNLEYWRENKCGERVLECIRQHPEFYWADQDAINMVLHKEILHVELRYNFQSLFYNPRKWKEYPNSFRKQILDEGKDPVVVHYSGPGKPWNFRYYGAPYYEDWDNVRNSSMWRDCKIKKPFVKYCKYLVKRYLIPNFLIRQIKSSWIVVPQNKHCYHV